MLRPEKFIYRPTKRKKIVGSASRGSGCDKRNKAEIVRDLPLNVGETKDLLESVMGLSYDVDLSRDYSRSKEIFWDCYVLSDDSRLLISEQLHMVIEEAEWWTVEEEEEEREIDKEEQAWEEENIG